GSGRDDLAEKIYEIGADPQGRRPEFAADARLRLADLRRDADPPRHEEAIRTYHEAILSTEIRGAADAAITLGEVMQGGATSSNGTDFHARLIEQVAQEAESKPSFVVAFGREMGERLTAMGEKENAIAVYRAVAGESDALADR